jgi:hypothetical protein
LDTTFSVSVTSLRPLKNALRDAFPTAKSSHLSEALAAGLGYNTYAAQLASHKTALATTLLTMRPAAFYARLQQLGYSVDQSVSLAAIHVGAAGTSLPEAFRADQAQLLELLDSTAPTAPQERARLRRRLAVAFGTAFGLGHIETSGSGKGVVEQLQVGIDYKACMPGWGAVANQDHTNIEFPGQDHMQYYYEYLPLDSGKRIEYCTARVSMPYLKEDGSVPSFTEAQDLAKLIGWRVELAPEWSWHMAGSTGLVLFRRSTSHTEMVRQWAGSFKKWLFENKSRLVNGRDSLRRQVVNDMLTCPHFPLTVASYEELRHTYLEQYAPYLFRGQDHRITDYMSQLFAKWSSEKEASS